MLYEDLRLINVLKRIVTNDLKRTFTNDNESGWSPIRQYAHDDAGWFSSMCEEALIFEKTAISLF